MALHLAGSQAAMLALTAAQGDDCFRIDLTQLYTLAGADPTVLDNWQPVTTVGEKIIQKIVLLLTATLAGIAGVFDQRVRPFEEMELPAVNVLPGKEVVTYPTATKRTATAAQHELHVIVRIEASGDPPQTDSLRVLIVRVLMADRSLGGLATGMGENELEWEDEAGTDATYGVLKIDFEVQYVTATNDATVQIG